MKVLFYRITVEEGEEYPASLKCAKGLKENFIGGIYKVNGDLSGRDTFNLDIDVDIGCTVKKTDCVPLPEGEFRFLDKGEVMNKGDLLLMKTYNEFIEIDGLAGNAFGEWAVRLYALRKVEVEEKVKRKSKFIVPMDLIKECV